MKPRAGITLIETLVAIFIMAIGLLALLTLFPLGALNMAQAIRDQRLNEAAEQANAIADARAVRTDTSVTAAFANGGVGALPGYWPGHSYPVFVDPWGRRIGSPASLGPVQRVDLSFTNNSRPNTFRWCALQDELTFQPDGTPDLTSGLQREPRTTWAYWLKRPDQTQPNVVEMSIVVYSGRDLQLPSSETAANNVAYSATDPTAVALDASAGRPDIRRGMWIVDVTTNNPATQRAQALSYGPVQGFWYRVVDVTDTSVNGADAVQLELQPKPTVPMTQVYIMAGVAEVFPKGTGWK
jgi:hypothetical protein